jgi:hypothetical protein
MEIGTHPLEEIALWGWVNIDHPKILLAAWKYLRKNR